MRSRRFQPAIGVVVAVVSVVAACTSEVADGGETVVASDVQALDLNRSCTDSFASIYAKPQNLGSASSNNRGVVLKCAPDRTIPVSEIQASLDHRGFVGITALNAVQVYRIQYRTERFNGKADVSSALVLLPAGRRYPGASTATTGGAAVSGAAVDTAAADGLAVQVDDSAVASGRGGGTRRPPLIVFGHGTVPYGNTCAYSKNDPTADVIPGMDQGDRELGSVLAFATRGFAVIMSDYAGFVQGSQVGGYLFSQDEARSVLDATRAMGKLLRDPPDRVAFVGHSQGGHAVLSAQAIARSYGMAGQLVGVAAFAPFWAPGRTLGAIVSPAFGFNTTDAPGPLAFAIEYFYTHAELYDGQGRGANLFVPSVREALLGYVRSCDFAATPAVLGYEPTDFFQPDFLTAVSNCGLDRNACSGGIAGTWETRFRADRPALDRRGAPVVMWQGKFDAVIPTSFAKCAIDKLRQDLPGNGSAKFTLCGDADADHESVQGDNLAWVMQWIQARAFGAPEPAACAGEAALTDPETGPLECQTPPGNQD
jgi:pimeloyl-ACP methyl ester carboxylesterase